MITYTQDLETKVPHIDEQHKELIKRINNVMELGAQSESKEETDKTIGLLESYIVEHFRDEEELQVKSGYPMYDQHCEQHRQFVELFQTLKAKYEKEGPSFNFTLQLNNSIINWILKHIRTMDKELGKFIQGQL